MSQLPHRILEPEVMDTEQDAIEYDAMDFLASDTLFAEHALRLLGNVSPARALDVGTGTAKIPILLAQKHPALSVLGIDAAHEMLRVAHRNVQTAGLSSRISLAPMNGRSLSLPATQFDLVLCNSVVHHQEDPRVLFQELFRVLRPNGALIVRDLLRPASTEEAWSMVERVAPNDSPHQKQLFFASLCASLTLDEVRDCLHSLGQHTIEPRQVSDRHWSVERCFTA